jgi:hypothetical protein
MAAILGMERCMVIPMDRQVKYLTGSHGWLGIIIVLSILYLSKAYAGGPVFEEGLAAFSSGDVATAFQLWEPLAEHGDADSQFALGSLYYNGIGVAVDHTESSYWFLLAAEQGLAFAQYNLGNAYSHGEGVRQDYKMAAYWWKKAAKQGLSVAQSNLDRMYQGRSMLDKNKQSTTHAYRQSQKKADPPDLHLNAKYDNATWLAGDDNCQRWLGNQSPNTYTIQLMSTRYPNGAYELAKQNDLSGYVVCRYAHKGHTRHALLFGTYPNVRAASEVVANLPAELKTGKPWIRKIKDFKQLVEINDR